MIEVNLIPDEERKKVRRVRVARPRIGIPGLDMFLSVILLLAAAGALFFINRGKTSQINSLDDKITAARQELRELEKEKKLVEDIQQRQNELTRWVSLVQDLNKDRALTFHIMDELNRLKPDYMWFVSFEENAGNFKIEGKTFSNLIISNFMVRLRESPYFTNIQLQEITERRERDQDVMGFIVIGKLITSSGG
jgi:type IV pilus assembly protein PilN